MLGLCYLWGPQTYLGLGRYVFIWGVGYTVLKKYLKVVSPFKFWVLPIWCHWKFLSAQVNSETERVLKFSKTNDGLAGLYRSVQFNYVSCGQGIGQCNETHRPRKCEGGQFFSLRGD